MGKGGGLGTVVKCLRWRASGLSNGLLEKRDSALSEGHHFPSLSRTKGFDGTSIFLCLSEVCCQDHEDHRSSC